MNGLTHRYVWKNRQRMVERGARIKRAHFRGRLDYDAFHIWFQRNLKYYAASTHSRNQKPQDMYRVENAFWLDAEKYCVENWYGWTWEEYTN